MLTTAPPPNSLFRTSADVLSFHLNKYKQTTQINDRYAPPIGQTSTPHHATKAMHSMAPSFSKRPLSLPSKEHADASLPKHPCSFHTDSQMPASFVSHSTYETPSIASGMLPVCAVCLERHKHTVPVVFCAAKRTWNDQFDTFVECFNKALCVKESGAILCHMWQRDNGHHEKHNIMHACSGCGALMHGASTCPQAQKAPAVNAV